MELFFFFSFSLYIKFRLCLNGPICTPLFLLYFMFCIFHLDSNATFNVNNLAQKYRYATIHWFHCSIVLYSRNNSIEFIMKEFDSWHNNRPIDMNVLPYAWASLEFSDYIWSINWIQTQPLAVNGKMCTRFMCTETCRRRYCNLLVICNHTRIFCFSIQICTISHTNSILQSFSHNKHLEIDPMISPGDSSILIAHQPLMKTMNTDEKWKNDTTLCWTNLHIYVILLHFLTLQITFIIMALNFKRIIHLANSFDCHWPHSFIKSKIRRFIYFTLLEYVLRLYKCWQQFCLCLCPHEVFISIQ